MQAMGYLAVMLLFRSVIEEDILDFLEEGAFYLYRALHYSPEKLVPDDMLEDVYKAAEGAFHIAYKYKKKLREEYLKEGYSYRELFERIIKIVEDEIGLFILADRIVDTMFWSDLTELEQDEIIDTFEADILLPRR